MLTSYNSLNPLFLLEGLNFVPNFQKNGGGGGGIEKMPFFVGGLMGKRGEDYRFYIKSKIKSLMKYLMKY